MGELIKKNSLVIKEKKARRANLTEDELVAAITATGGSLTATAELLNIEIGNFWRAKEKFPKAKEKYETLRKIKSELVLDNAINNVQAEAEKGDLNVSMAYVSMIQKVNPEFLKKMVSGLSGNETKVALTEEQEKALDEDVERVTADANGILKADLVFPVDFRAVFQLRGYIQERCLKDENYVDAVWRYYGKNPVDFISHWCGTHDPRKAGEKNGAYIPFVLFKKQRQLVQFFDDMRVHVRPGLVEKSRDVGATWTASAYSVWCWVFIPGSAIGWGSKTKDLVDKIGSMGSIFEKMRDIIKNLPPFFKPKKFTIETDLKAALLSNKDNKATIVGEGGPAMGRGNRFTMMFKDESAHYEQPDDVEKALAATTNVPIDMSSVNGTTGPFFSKRSHGLDYNPDIPYVPGKNREQVNVFVMPWNANPLDKTKDEKWYKDKKRFYEMSGRGAAFAQEYDRNYYASIINIIIRPEWVESAKDAHIKLNHKENGVWIAGFDIAAAGKDTNALVVRRGMRVCSVDEWGHSNYSTMKAVTLIKKFSDSFVCQFDPIGVGEVVNVEVNRLRNEGKIDKRQRFVPWDASAAPLYPDKVIMKGEEGTNADILENLKAQGWHELSIRFRKTHLMVKGEAKFPLDELISIPSTLPLYNKLVTELGQPTFEETSSGKTKVKKTAKGGSSPNLADALMMAYHPIITQKGRISLGSTDIFSNQKR